MTNQQWQLLLDIVNGKTPQKPGNLVVRRWNATRCINRKHPGV